MRKKIKKTKRGSGHTRLDPEMHTQNLGAKPGRDLAAEALAAQAERRREKAEAAKAEAAKAEAEEDPPRKSSQSSASDPTEFQENPLHALRARKSQPPIVKGTLGQKNPNEEGWIGVHKRVPTKSGRRSRKNKKRKTRRRR